MQNDHIASKIKYVCKNKGLTITSVLSECNISKSFIYDLERRAASPSCEKVSRIADYLDCSVDYLLGRTDIAERQHLTSAEALVTVNSTENVLLSNFRDMNTAGQDYILQTIDMAKDKYKKCDSVSDRESIG